MLDMKYSDMKWTNECPGIKLTDMKLTDIKITDMKLEVMIFKDKKYEV